MQYLPAGSMLFAARLAAAWWIAAAPMQSVAADAAPKLEHDFTVASASDLMTQLGAWIEAHEQRLSRDVAVTPAGAWRLPENVSGTFHADLSWRSVDQHHRHALIGLKAVNGQPAGSTTEVRFAVEDVARVWVTTSALTKGGAVDCTTVTAERRPVSRARAAWQGDCASASGLQVQRSLDRGDVVRMSDVGTPPDVKQDSEASVAVDVGVIRIDARGIALADGRLGEDIPVRLLGQGKVVRATVIAPGQLTLARSSK